MIKIAAIIFIAATIVAYVMGKTGANFHAVDAAKELAQGDLVFMSWDGVWHGTDNDTVFKFSPNGTVEIEYCGFGLRRVVTTYKAIGSTITIDTHWHKIYSGQASDEAIPQLMLRRDKGALYLFPASVMWAAKYSDFYGWPLRQPRDRNDSQIEKH